MLEITSYTHQLMNGVRGRKIGQKLRNCASRAPSIRATTIYPLAYCRTRVYIVRNLYEHPAF